MTPDQSRLETDRATPRILALWHALSALKTPVLFMQSGAHPDDEMSAMLAALRFRDGIDLAYVCSTRGEGGQNDIGREAGAALGALRTAEMEGAAHRLDMRLWWMGEGPDDPMADFGFSKSGEETLARWGREHTLRTFVRAVRQARPDILCPTFLDVPGQHGHHRAMTLIAHEVMECAADPAFVIEGATPWQVAKLYLPAWSGAGTAYDDDLPPPPETVMVSGEGRDPVTGWTWARMGQHSRALHRTQGMGHWPRKGRDFPLHLVGGGAEASILDGLPADLGALGHSVVQEAMDAAIAAWPDGASIARHAAEALSLLPDQPDGPDAHRLERKRKQLARVLWLASGAEVRGAAARSFVAPGESAGITLEPHAGDAEALEAQVLPPEGWTGDTPDPGHVPPAYPMTYDPLDPPRPGIAASAIIAGQGIEVRLPLDRTAAALPAGVTLDPPAEVINLATSARSAAVVLRPESAALELPDGWNRTDGTLSLPESAKPGHHDLPVTLDSAPAFTVMQIEAPHTAPRVLARPAVLRLALLDVALPEARIAVVGAGRDRVAHWLRRIGADVTEPDLAAIDAGLPGVDTLVLGIFALRFRPGLAERIARIATWVREGGTLVTLYHRPWDNWDPAAMPARLEIGQPSLRWRVTDERAEVTHLAPDHPILTGPNPIGPEDWRGWHKERGLYFAARWDEAYRPLLSMADPGEAPLEGALVSAEIGAGRHSHCALILHHQMEQLVPGAFRLMANLCDPRR
ncbi:PIG-L family deacetylase [Pontivivens ytuae]|uniref:PIG-L family deacetylase n=1 Tax=Pontivivens ytuae TaxID=2789856 RepID=A0A7S9LPK1_9RHOB|nr:PIG-L family deacetylase [Pontivivens ytuae]QPH52934.1 PIG-L family deacetylase [Pontivivens ytuae]